MLLGEGICMPPAFPRIATNKGGHYDSGLRVEIFLRREFQIILKNQAQLKSAFYGSPTLLKKSIAHRDVDCHSAWDPLQKQSLDLLA